MNMQMKHIVVLLLFVLLFGESSSRERVGRLAKQCDNVCKAGVTKTTGHLFWKQKQGPDPSDCCKDVKQKDFPFVAGMCIKEGTRFAALCFMD